MKGKGVGGVGYADGAYLQKLKKYLKCSRILKMIFHYPCCIDGGTKSLSIESVAAVKTS